MQIDNHLYEHFVSLIYGDISFTIVNMGCYGSTLFSKDVCLNP